MSNISTSKGGLTRYDPSTSTCYGKNIDNFFNGFFGQFQDSFCYTFVIQFIIVSLMYTNVGRGRYWKMLFYASLAGLLGAILENATVAYICTNANENVRYTLVVPFLLDELFWAPCEYAIPYLNLIKMKAYSKGKLASAIRYVIIGLTVPFAIFRFLIGYTRMKNGYLQDETIHAYHGGAFAVMALADIICTFAILYFVRKNNNQVSLEASNINNYIKHSSYTILLAVDIVSLLLSICNIFSNIGPLKDDFPNKLVTPLHSLKCSFILILAADALIFKYGANVSSNISSGNNSKTYGNGSDSYHNNNYKSAIMKQRLNNNYSVDMTNNNSSISKSKANQNTIISISPYNYPTIDHDIYSKSPENSGFNKTIVKNYTNSSPFENPSEKFEMNSYPSQTFGFLNQQTSKNF